MTLRRITFAPLARAQARDVARWWIESRPAARTLFANELREALTLISDTPGVGVAWPHPTIPGLRRVLLAGTRHHLYYVYDATTDGIEVLAIWGAVRGAPPRFRP